MPLADLFFVAYTSDAVSGQRRRPLTFAFSGGPGCSAAWLHFGLGPRRLPFSDGGCPPAPPYTLVPNEFTLLRETDLVFVDPIGTGYSRAASPADAAKFLTYEMDLLSMAQFIHRFLTHQGRVTSPLFLLGESYGAIRAAGLSSVLHEKYFTAVDGIVMISPVINMQTIMQDRGNDLAFILCLPSYAAAAWHHKRLPAVLQALTLPDLMQKARCFAERELASALFLGSALDPTERTRVVGEFSRLTGLEQELVSAFNLRVPAMAFAVHMLKDQRLTLGRLDSRRLGHQRARLADVPTYDFAAAPIMTMHGEVFRAYASSELKLVTELPYEVVAFWTPRVANGYLDLSSALANAVNRNVRVHIVCGYFDLATPWLSIIYSVRHLQVPPEARGRITLAEYNAGHMIYHSPAELKRQAGDLAAFFSSAAHT